LMWGLVRYCACIFSGLSIQNGPKKYDRFLPDAHPLEHKNRGENTCTAPGKYTKRGDTHFEKKGKYTKKYVVHVKNIVRTQGGKILIRCRTNLHVGRLQGQHIRNNRCNKNLLKCMNWISFFRISAKKKLAVSSEVKSVWNAIVCSNKARRKEHIISTVHR
jgi:hypothetical protein